MYDIFDDLVIYPSCIRYLFFFFTHVFSVPYSLGECQKKGGGCLFAQKEQSITQINDFLFTRLHYRGKY